MKRVFWISLVVVILAALWAGVASAQGSAPTDDDVNRVAKQLFCPVCESTPLDVCPTQACAQWRDLIRQKLAEGWTDEEIKQYFVEQYGVRVLAEPPREGLNWLVYIVPAVLFVAGVVILVRTMRSMKADDEAEETPQSEAAQAGAGEDDYIARLEAEIRAKK